MSTVKCNVSITTGWIKPSTCWPHGGTIQQCWSGYVCLPHNFLFQYPLISGFYLDRSQSPLTINLITIIAFINSPIATHFDTIKGHAIHFIECVVPLPAYIQPYRSGLNAFGIKPDSSHIYFALFMFNTWIAFFKKTGMGNKGAFGVKISVHVSPGSRGAVTSDNIEGRCKFFLSASGAWYAHIDSL